MIGPQTFESIEKPGSLSCMRRHARGLCDQASAHYDTIHSHVEDQKKARPSTGHR